MSSGNKYHRSIWGLRTYGHHQSSMMVDVYAVLNAFAVVRPGSQHAIKKLLCAGLRNKGSELQDLHEARDALDRAIEDAERDVALEEIENRGQTTRNDKPGAATG